MSFSSDIKTEILKEDMTKKCCILSEEFGENLTQVRLKSQLEEKFKRCLDIANLEECCIRAVLKGAFLGGGYITSPESDYNLELTTKNKACAEYLYKLLALLEFTPKIIKKEKLGLYSTYIKEAEQICNFLRIIEANVAVMKFEQVRVEKEIKNNINRTLNCETANLTKTITSAVRQLDAIDKIRKSGLYEKLDDKSKEAILLREKFKYESLNFIASSADNVSNISRSGLKHRLDKIIKIADEIKNEM